MRTSELEARMRALEYFHGLRLLPGAWPVVRVDGRSFTRLTGAHFAKPFDPLFHELMVGTARALLEELQGVYAHTQSDEVSVLLPRATELFDRELEKLVSLSAAIATAAFTHAFGQGAQFDARVWLGVDAPPVVGYFRWRQADAGRCALNGWCYWTLVKTGRSPRQASAALLRQRSEAKHELLFRHGVTFAAEPSWQRRGSGLYYSSYEKEGFNPRTGETVRARRRRVRVESELPIGEEYAALVRGLVGSVRADPAAPRT
jgi:tRNA(His) 5'-end guanylyltransferase